MIRTELRYAIWLAYGKKDAYGRGLIEDYTDLEIDHIIPRSIDEDLLKLKIEKYDLGSEFSIDSIENLIPTSKAYNRLKGEIVFDESHERYFLGIAKGKKQRIEEELSKVIRNLRLKEKVQFNESYKITDSSQVGIKPTYFYSKTLVALNGYLPYQYDGIGSCTIEFYEIGLMITLNHEVLSELINTEKNSGIENQVLHYYDDRNERAFVIIGTSSIHLRKEAYDQFLEILKDFLSLYKKYFQLFSDFFEINGFIPIESRDRYVLCEIDQVQWEILISHTSKYNLNSGANVDFYFNTTSSSLIAIDKDESVVKFAVTHHILTSSMSNKAVLVWHLPKMSERKFVESGKIFTAKKTLAWIQCIIEEYRIVENHKEENINSTKNRHMFSFIKKIKHLIRN